MFSCNVFSIFSQVRGPFCVTRSAGPRATAPLAPLKTATGHAAHSKPDFDTLLGNTNMMAIGKGNGHTLSFVGLVAVGWGQKAAGLTLLTAKFFRVPHSRRIHPHNAGANSGAVGSHKRDSCCPL